MRLAGLSDKIILAVAHRRGAIRRSVRSDEHHNEILIGIDHRAHLTQSGGNVLWRCGGMRTLSLATGGQQNRAALCMQMRTQDLFSLRRFAFENRLAPECCNDHVHILMAGALRLAQTGRLRAGDVVVCTLTGHGLKDPDNAIANAEPPVTIPADLARLAALLELE
jgi:hypothetical protein